MNRGYASMTIASTTTASMTIENMEIENMATEDTAPSLHPAGPTAASEVTIVIPPKNEAKLIPRLLTALTMQDYAKMSSTRVLVADANSTDGTPEIVMGFRDRLNVSVIRGGMPSVGRNHGAALADTPYVLFLDADIELADRSLLRRCIERVESKQLHCVTTNIVCKDGSWVDRLFYGI